MTTTDFVTKTWVKSNGEIPTFASGSDEWSYILVLGNYWIDQWANEQSVDWNSLYDPAYEIGTIDDASALAIEFDSTEVRKFSQNLGDAVRITWLDGVHYTEYDMVSADDLQNYKDGNYCARVGSTLRFSNTISEAAAEFGGTVTAPVYLYPTHLVKDKDVVPVDDPNWLVAIVAAEVARNDILRKDQYPILSSEANGIMERMMSDNEGQFATVNLSWNPGGSEE